MPAPQKSSQVPAAILSVMAVAGCTFYSSGLCQDDHPGTRHPEGWSSESHCKGIEPGYEKLFDDTVVNRFDIIIDSETYEIMMEDLEEKLGGGGPIEGDAVPDPLWVPVTVKFQERSWQHVGMRFKGNASLRAAYQMGVKKLAFRLNFDMYEEGHPEIRDQRFFGFTKMTFSNNYEDPSLLRDKLAADIFRDAGVPAARGAFVRVYLDHGEGTAYMGLYTMVEDPSDKMLGVVFGNEEGNLYKPEGEGGRWASLEPQVIETAFRNVLDEQNLDLRDVKAAITALHADRIDAGTWRSELEAVFDVESFLGYLAVSSAMVNWDSYGAMPHNYYLYADPDQDGRLVWFPWDLNETMCTPPSDRSYMSSVTFDDIVDADPSSPEFDSKWNWPLIRFLLGDTVYRSVYEDDLRACIEGAFAVERVFERMESCHELIAPYVVGPEEVESYPYTFIFQAEDFSGSLTTGPNALKPWVEARHEAVRAALGM